MNTLETQRAIRRNFNPIALGVFLIAMHLVCELVFAVNSRGAIPLLGWSKNPGLTIMFSLVVLAVYSLFRHESISRVIFVFALYTTPMCLDFICDLIRLIADIFPLPTPVWLLLAFLPLLLGGCCVYRMRLHLIAKAVYVIIAGYIESVHVYNSYYNAQYMGFFGGGWTA